MNGLEVLIVLDYLLEVENGLLKRVGHFILGLQACRITRTPDSHLILLTDRGVDHSNSLMHLDVEGLQLDVFQVLLQRFRELLIIKELVGLVQNRIG